MKTEELTALGLNEEQAKAVFAIYGKDVGALQKKVSALEAERDTANEKLTAANDTLAKYDGIDPAKYRDEIERYKKEIEDKEKAYNAKLTQRDQRDYIAKKLDEYGVKSPYARRQLTADAMDSENGLSWKDGAFFGFDDFMKAAHEKDDSLYLTEEQKKAAEEAAKHSAESEAAKKPGIVGKTQEPGTPAETKRSAPRIF